MAPRNASATPRVLSRLWLGLIGSMLALFTWTTDSQATVVTVGTPLPIHLSENTVLGCTDSCVLTNPYSAANSVPDVSPVNGVILRWRVDGAILPNIYAPNPSYRLRVLTWLGSPSSPRYLGAGTSAAHQVHAFREVETFPTLLPIKAGQLLALELENRESGVYFGFAPNISAVFIEPAMSDGESATPRIDWEHGFIFPFNADVLPPPEVTGISPNGGSFSKETQVTVSGQNFAEVRSVTFGTTQASFTVNSESQLTASVPPGPKLAAVPVRVVTAAGSAGAPGTYTYEACVVPKLRAKSLIAAKRALQRRKCTLGKVTRPHHAAGKYPRVKRQSPRAEAVLPLGGKVKVTLGLDPSAA